MITTTTIESRATTGRVAFAVLAALLLALIAAEAIKHSTGYWQIAAFGAGADLAIALATLAVLGVLSVGFFIGALTWPFHIALDRALLEEEGIEALSMRRIAQRLGIRAPSV
jgi:hypothetical protein